MNTLEPSFLIGSSSFFQITRSTFKAWMNLNLRQIQQPTTEKNECYHFFSIAVVLIFFKVAVNEEMLNSLKFDQIGPQTRE